MCIRKSVLLSVKKAATSIQPEKNECLWWEEKRVVEHREVR